LNPPVLIKVDQLPQGTLVRAEAVGCVKTAQTGAAQRAAAFGIQREGVEERGPAAYAEEFRDQRLRIPQAFRTDGDACDLAERLAANAAIVGEEKVKKGVGDCSDC
jgi:hypothetical protein